MTHRTPNEIRDKFNDLRQHCDPRGHELLDELENACLRDNALLAMQERIDDLQHELAGFPMADVIPLFPGWSVKVPS